MHLLYDHFVPVQYFQTLEVAIKTLLDVKNICLLISLSV